MYTYHQLQPHQLQEFKDLIWLFGEVFEEPQTYQQAILDDEYLKNFLSNDSHIVLIASDEHNQVVGGLVAYVLEKFEQNRKEIFVYDLAISAEHRRKGIGTALFEKLKQIAKQRNAYVIFVQAEEGDEEAVAFYRSLNNTEEKAHHFEINVL